MSGPGKAICEVVPSKTGNSWQVRITAQGRVQYISGFDSPDEAASWIAREADAWLAKLEQIAIVR